MIDFDHVANCQKRQRFLNCVLTGFGFTLTTHRCFWPPGVVFTTIPPFVKCDAISPKTRFFINLHPDFPALDGIWSNLSQLTGDLR